MRPYAPCLLSPARTHCEEAGRYQSLAHGFFIFCATWACVDVTSDWCIRSDCSWAPTAHKAFFFFFFRKKSFFPEAEFFLRLFHLKSEGYVARRSGGPINSHLHVLGTTEPDGSLHFWVHTKRLHGGPAVIELALPPLTFKALLVRVNASLLQIQLEFFMLQDSAGEFLSRLLEAPCVLFNET